MQIITWVTSKFSLIALDKIIIDVFLLLLLLLFGDIAADGEVRTNVFCLMRYQASRDSNAYSKPSPRVHQLGMNRSGTLGFYQ
jgi:hypothetical protein